MAKTENRKPVLARVCSLSPMSVSVFFTGDLRVFQFLSTSTQLLRLVSFYSMAHLTAGSFYLLVPSGRARVGFGVTTSVSGLGLGPWVSIRTAYPKRRGHGRPAPLPPPAPLLLTANLVFFLSIVHSECAVDGCCRLFSIFRRPSSCRPSLFHPRRPRIFLPSQYF